MTQASEYPLPEGELSLAGPVARPATGTLAIRGDLAHIALAQRYLVAHYVAPQLRRIGSEGATLMCLPRDDADPVCPLAPGEAFEALDFAGDWCWGCRGPEGPSGYVRTAQLAPIDAP